MIAGLYIRVSTDEQVRFGLSLDAQEQALKKYCKDNKIKIYGIYKDEGVSASTIKKRNGLLSLLDNLDAIDIVLFTKLDRLSRNIKDAIELNEQFKEHNVNMIAVQDQYIDTSTANGEFIFNLRYALAQQERKQISERVKIVNDYKRNVSKTAISGKIPFGYSLDKDKHFVINENAKIIQDLFNHYVANGKLMETRRWYENKYGKVCYDTIKRRLTNLDYTGVHKYNDTLIENYIPPIIDKDLFDKVQVLIKKNIKLYNKTCLSKNTIFNRLLVCPYCGSTFGYSMNKNSNVYYTCRNRYTNGCQNKAFLSELRLETYLLNNLPIELEKLKIKSKKYLKIDNSNIDKLKNKLNDKINRLQKAYIDGNLDYELYKNELADTKLQLSQIKEPKKVNIDELDKLLNSNALEIYKTFNKEEKRIFWRNIINTIEVRSTNELIINFIER